MRSILLNSQIKNDVMTKLTLTPLPSSPKIHLITWTASLIQIENYSLITNIMDKIRLFQLANLHGTFL